ncbi:MAG: DMT family transporter [Patescibacteria group bacterium]
MWLILALLAASMFTAQNLLMRVLAVKSVHPRTFSFVFNGWGTLFSILYIIIEPPSLTMLPNISSTQWLLIAGAVLGYGIFERTHFSVRKQLDASTTAILFRLTPVITLIGALLFLRESLSMTKLIGAALLICASLTVIHKNPKLQSSRTVWLAIFSATALGLAGLFDKPASQGIPASLYNVALWMLSMLVVAIPSLSLNQLKKEFYIGGWKVALTAFINVFGFILYLKALAITDVSLVAPITSSSGTLVILGGIIFLNERTYLWRKLTAGILMLIGVFLLR